jgi:hypothetical protein
MGIPIPQLQPTTKSDKLSDLAYPLSTRHVEELMEERGVEVDHSTINRWVIRYSPQLEIYQSCNLHKTLC